MIKGLSTAGLGQVKNVEELIYLAAQNGFGAIDTSGRELRSFIERKGLKEVKAILEQTNIVVGAIGLSVEWRTTDEEFKAGLIELVEDAKVASILGCTSVCTYVLPATDQNAVQFTLQATKRLRLCAQILQAYNMDLALEFVGPHHLRTAWKNPFIWDMKDMIEWIDVIGESNVGLLLDSYHWYTTGGTKEELLALKPQQITHVHINDAKDVPVEEVLDNDRLYPGEGVIDFSSFLGALKEIGYQGPVTQEILTIEPLTESAHILAEKSGKAFTEVFSII